MTIKSHNKVSGGSHKGRKENSKANGIWRQLSVAKYEREKDEIKVYLEVMMQLL